MKASCWICAHYCQRSYKVTTGQRNVSGGVAWYRIWSKHRCNLNQEDMYPRDCNFTFNTELWKELEERFPDLAAAHRRVDAFSNNRFS